MRMKEESEKADLKLSIQKWRSQHPVPSLHGKIDGEKVEAVTDFIFLGSKITAVTSVMKLKDALSLKWKLWQT